MVGDSGEHGPARVESIEVAGARLWTSTTGSGPPMVLYHGGPGGNSAFGRLTPMLDGIARVHVYDQRACGRSTGPGP
ncbi:MAG TPA: hypothetical protein VIA06_06185 [Candidatus Dormibacteraeota bacterium]|nr:hypothetical protein [Candidatus Dormibacteraeota bacterium]